MEFYLDKGLGYRVCYNPSHILANKAGKVYEHHYVWWLETGEVLEPGWCLHHRDRDRSNNDISNLQKLTNSEHSKLHMREDRGFEGCFMEKHCVRCGTKFFCWRREYGEQKFCSVDCSRASSRKFEVCKEELKTLVWLYPTTEVAKMFGVSDKAIEKRCKILGVDKPPRGFWTKKSI